MEDEEIIEKMEELKEIEESEEQEETKTLAEVFIEYKSNENIELKEKNVDKVDKTDFMKLSKVFINCYTEFKTKFADIENQLARSFIRELLPTVSRLTFLHSEYEDGNQLGDYLNKSEIKRATSDSLFQIHDFLMMYLGVKEDGKSKIEEALEELGKEDKEEEKKTGGESTSR